MSLMVLDLELADQLKAQRQASGADRYDEVWEGVYMMAPLANNEHQHLQLGLAAAIKNAVGWGTPVQVLAGANVSDREAGWEHNYRCPDVVVVFPGGAARDCGTHWCGGPDFCVEITSRGDRSRDKLDFYAGIGVRELMLVDRDPWALELYQLNSRGLALVGRSDLGRTDALPSTVVPVSFRLVPGADRPAVDVMHRDGVQHWLV
jgi:Uma2 family endonuclease